MQKDIDKEKYPFLLYDATIIFVVIVIFIIGIMLV